MTPEQELKLVADVSAIRAETSAQSATLKAHSEALGRVDYALNGNGKPGLKHDVKDIQDRMKKYEGSLANWNKAAWIVGTPVLAALGGGLVAASVWLLHTVK